MDLVTAYAFEEVCFQVGRRLLVDELNNTKSRFNPNKGVPMHGSAIVPSPPIGHGHAVPAEGDTLTAVQNVALDHLASLESRVEELKCRLQGYPPPTPTNGPNMATERIRPNGAHETALEIRSSVLRLGDTIGQILTRL